MWVIAGPKFSMFYHQTGYTHAEISFLKTCGLVFDVYTYFIRCEDIQYGVLKKRDPLTSRCIQFDGQWPPETLEVPAICSQTRFAEISVHTFLAGMSGALTKIFQQHKSVWLIPNKFPWSKHSINTLTKTFWGSAPLWIEMSCKFVFNHVDRIDQYLAVRTKLFETGDFWFAHIFLWKTHKCYFFHTDFS